MVTDKQAARRERIEAAAYAVLEENGYKGASMLAIAKRASASNETLYNWYGSKQALFCALVEANAREARELLEAALRQDGQSPFATLEKLGPVLLALVTGEKAIALNRAAAAAVSYAGRLGRAIGEAGRGVIAPLVRALVERARAQGAVACDDPAEAAELYLHLLIGDLQIQRVIGVLDPLPPDEIARRSKRALAAFAKLYAPATAQAGGTRHQ